MDMSTYDPTSKGDDVLRVKKVIDYCKTFINPDDVNILKREYPSPASNEYESHFFRHFCN